MKNAPDGYERGCNILLAIVQGWTGEPPRFAFPPKGVVLIADLRGIGDKLCRNDGARHLLAFAIRRCLERTGQAPTSLMLEVVLDVAHVPYERVPLEELGLGAVADQVKARRPH